MLALTIHNPFAHLLVTPQSELPDGAIEKCVENRTWDTKVRGTIAIHAGVSMKWFSRGDWPLVPDTKKLTPENFQEMAFGAIVGTADLVDVLSIMEIRFGRLKPEYAYLQSHKHCEGPFCFVLENRRRLKKPVPATGKQGFWKLSDDQLSLLEYP